MLTIADCKRNDIGSTAKAYSRAYLGEILYGNETVATPFEADAITVNGYLGSDGIQPFLDDCMRFGKGIFVLVRTSNPSAGELQDLLLADGRTVAEAMADLVNGWSESLIGASGLSSVGAVVGATWPEQARALRERMPNVFFLVPGYGAQGGRADDAVAGFTPDGRGAIVNSSRALMCAWKDRGAHHEDFAAACRAAALDMRQALRDALAARSGNTDTEA